jgi:hypothetical protein
VSCGKRLTSSLKSIERALEKAEREKRVLEAQMSALGTGLGNNMFFTPDEAQAMERLRFRLQQMWDQRAHLRLLVQMKRAAAADSAKHEQAGDTAPKTEEEAPAQLQPATVAKGGSGSGRRAAKWEDIEISFLSDERVQIRNGPQPETRNYAELGFEDRRNGKPNRAWLMLRDLAEMRGIIRYPTKTCGVWSKVEKRMQEIRKALRQHFGISTDSVPFIEGTGYQAQFKIGCSPSFDA